MDKILKLDDDRLVTRDECRAMGLRVTSTTFGRWEDAKLLTPVKPGGKRSSRVFYWLSNVMTMLGTRS